jgi:hypothetical protein
MSASDKKIIIELRFLGAFAKLRQATVSFVMSVCPSIRVDQLGSQWMNFHVISYLSVLHKFVEKFQVLLQSDMNNGYFM